MWGVWGGGVLPPTLNPDRIFKHHYVCMSDSYAPNKPRVSGALLVSVGFALARAVNAAV